MCYQIYHSDYCLDHFKRLFFLHKTWNHTYSFITAVDPAVALIFLLRTVSSQTRVDCVTFNQWEPNIPAARPNHAILLVRYPFKEILIINPFTLRSYLLGFQIKANRRADRNFGIFRKTLWLSDKGNFTKKMKTKEKKYYKFVCRAAAIQDQLGKPQKKVFS